MAVLKIILVAMLLATMMLILLSIGHLSHGTFHHDADDLDDLRREVDEEESVIGRGNIFRTLVGSYRRSARNAGK
ncbi:MAG: hypothetical protein K2G53_03835 [Muribaculaceae bacterium]|nr:hypothetical protein [Bacteroides sp.]MDE6071664.1 hypothetical protein [Muribaculaceae bacterium]